MKNISKSLFNKWGAGEQNPRQSRFMPTLGRTYGPGENPNTGRSASQFESRKTSKKNERAAESSRKAKELRYEAESQVSDIKKAADPSPVPLAPNRRQFDNTDAGRRGYEFAQQDYNERKAKFDLDMYKAAREKVLAEEKSIAMLKAGTLIKDPGKAPEIPITSGNKIRDAKALRKYEKALASWKENANAYMQQRAFLTKLAEEQEKKDDSKRAGTDQQKESLSKPDLDTIRQAYREQPTFTIGANKGTTMVRIDGGGSSLANGAFSGVVWAVGKMWIGVSTSDTFTASTDRTLVTATSKKAYVKVPFDGSAPTWQDGPPTDSDLDDEWYYIAATYGDIHVPRA